VSRRRLERLLNLTMCLMATSRFLTVADIGEMVEGYDPGVDEDGREAFRRMFERDKQYLRDLGIPLETGADSTLGDDVGYRIRRSDYALPEISLGADEAAALALAANLWSTSTLAAPAASAVRKLVAGGAADGAGAVPDDLGGFEPRVGAAEPAFDAALAAVQKGQAVRFPYRKPGGAAAEQRHVDPWGVVSWRGRWYLVGHDRARDAARVFRLSRVTGPVRAAGKPGEVAVPTGVDLRSLVVAAAPVERTLRATLRIRPGRGHALRRYGRPAAPARPGGAGSASGEAGEFDLVEIDYADTERLARWIVGHGPDVLVAGPPELRAEVVRRLRAAAAHTGR
jgi:proteasome accessory factor B/proteasome accessory factor C